MCGVYNVIVCVCGGFVLKSVNSIKFMSLNSKFYVGVGEDEEEEVLARVNCSFNFFQSPFYVTKNSFIL